MSTTLFRRKARTRVIQFRVYEDIYAELKASAKGSRWSISEEAKMRVLVSLAYDAEFERIRAEDDTLTPEEIERRMFPDAPLDECRHPAPVTGCEHSELDYDRFLIFCSLS